MSRRVDVRLLINTAGWGCEGEEKKEGSDKEGKGREKGEKEGRSVKTDTADATLRDTQRITATDGVTTREEKDKKKTVW
jgi:hypothetical protein